MTRTLVIAGIFALGLGPSAFAAGGMKCDDASMMQMQADMDANTMATKDQKDMAMKEMMMAKDSMKSNKLDDCSMHMGKAMDAMKMEAMKKG